MFSEHYPNLNGWVVSHGWIEVGEDEHYSSWLRIFDIGGMCWEAEEAATLDEALKKIAPRTTQFVRLPPTCSFGTSEYCLLFKAILRLTLMTITKKRLYDIAPTTGRKLSKS